MKRMSLTITAYVVQTEVPAVVTGAQAPVVSVQTWLGGKVALLMRHAPLRTVPPPISLQIRFHRPSRTPRSTQWPRCSCASSPPCALVPRPQVNALV